MLLQRPEKDSPRSRVADWLELLAVSKPDRAFGSGEIKKILRVEEEERLVRKRADLDGESLEGEITETPHDELVSEVCDELERREKLLGASYPFLLTRTRSGIASSFRFKWRGDEIEDCNATYLYCLLISGVRLTMTATTAADDASKIGTHNTYSEFMYGRLLQICASIALGGYLRGRVISFGYPRPNKGAFLSAHQQVWNEFGAYKPVSVVPMGAPSDENDAGIDLIGWLDFGDRQGSKVLIFGQVASGRNWSGKTVVGNAKSLKGWFSEPAFEHFIPLMVMPFNASDARRSVMAEPGDMRPLALVWEDREFGILMDRDRVAGCAGTALKDASLVGLVDNLDKISEVTAWVKRAVISLKANA